MSYQLRVKHGALDELNGNIVLRGVIDQGCFPDIKIGEYQREEARLSTINKMVEALKEGARFPDIEVGIRGSDYQERNGVFFIRHDCFVIDGLQRLSAAKRFLASGFGGVVHLGALLHFGTTEEWERERFKILNMDRARVSPNVLLRNEVSAHVVKALVAMSQNDREFVLRNKICWNQRMARGELLAAFLVMKVIGTLHSHFGPGLSNKMEDLVKAMDKTFGIVGSNTWRANVRTFFGVLDQAFGVRTIAYRDLSPHIKGSFLFVLAKIFADHQTFWDGQRLEVARHDIEKLRAFPINDPGILTLIGSGSGKLSSLLYGRLIQHLNSGRRTRKILRWNGQPASEIQDGSLFEGGDTEDDGNGTSSVAAEMSCKAA